MNKQFSVVIKKNAGVFNLWVPELGLFAEGPDMAIVYKELMLIQTEYLKKIETLGLMPELEKKLQNPEIKTFPKKALWAALGVFVLSVLIMLGTASRSVNKLSEKLTDALNAPPEKQKEYLERYHHFLIKIRPYWEETQKTLGAEGKNNGNS